MKKNAMLKIAAILMVAVLLTTCAISSTFAKYTTTESSVATARVAKWGVDVTTSIEGLFAETRALDDGTLIVKSAAAADDDVTDNVVAPGMSGEVSATRTLTGTPEVAVKISSSADVVLAGWGDHCPLVFKVNGGNDIKQTGTVAQLQDAIATAINIATTQAFEAGKDLSTVEGTAVLVTWSWPFEISGGKEAVDASNQIDTDLGDLEEAPTVTITLTTTVEQVETLTIN